MTKLIVKCGDITRETVDVIVNAANEYLAGGGGVDGAIHRAAGPRLAEACERLRQELGPKPCPTGHALATEAGNLAARHVVHTVGPVWRGGDYGERSLLALCYRNSLMAALEVGARTIAFPCISTGIFGYPPGPAAEVAVETVRGFDMLAHFEAVHFVVFSESDRVLYEELVG